MPTKRGVEPFDRELFEELCIESGLDRDSQRAKALEVDQATVYRVQAGVVNPSLRFANACRRVFGLEAYVQLFPLKPTEETTDERIDA